jgi:hypothetical protein
MGRKGRERDRLSGRFEAQAAEAPGPMTGLSEGFWKAFPAAEGSHAIQEGIKPWRLPDARSLSKAHTLCGYGVSAQVGV